MSTTPYATDATSTTDRTDPAHRTDVPIQKAREQRGTSRASAGAPMQFSTTNRKPLPPAFGDESWVTGEP